MPPAEGSRAGPRAEKSASAFRTTGEAAAVLDLPPHVLRFWESKFPQLKPLKRSGGRRYYRPQDIDLLRRIRRCLYQEGYTIRGVQKLLRDGTLGGGEPAAAGEEHDAPLEPPAAPVPLRPTLVDLHRQLHEIRALLAALLSE